MNKQSKILDRIEKQEDDRVRVQSEREILRLRAQIEDLQYRNKLLHDDLDLSERRQMVVDALREERMHESWERDRKKKSNTHSAIAVLSDWHWEETVSRDQTNGLNEYNVQIARRRAKHTFQKIAEYYDRYTSGPDELIVGVLGDMITGFIHEELEETNGMSPTEAMLDVADNIVSGLEFLERETKAKKILVPCCFGNHSRTTKKRRVKTEWRHSIEFAMYEWLKSKFATHPKIRFKVEKGYFNLVECQNRLIRFHHGHSVKFCGGIGGITIPVNKKIARWDVSRKADLDMFGHFHGHLCGDKWFCNGSLIGVTEYSLDLGCSPEKPTQGFVVFDGKYGLRTVAKIISD